MADSAEPTPAATGSDRLPVHEMRASDADRERVAAVLREAAGEGRIGLDELDERLGAVYAARTYAELEPITRDLPAPGEQPVAIIPAAAVPAQQSERFGGVPASKGAFALMSGFERRGRWVVPRVFRAGALMGGGEIDLREARFAAQTVTIHAWTFMGGIEIIVPEDAEVHVVGLGIMGGFDHNAAGVGEPGAPTIVVKGLAVMGGVSVERKPPEEELKRRKLARKEERKRAKLERKQLKSS
jgi:Domain of unknown function (DUF1707)